MPARCRRATELAVALVVLVAALVATAGPASAHAGLVATEPDDGTVLASAPPELRLRFDEDVRADIASVTLVGPDGAVPLGPLVAGPSRRVLTVRPQRPLGVGVYRLGYKVRDPVDLHLAAGTVVFGVGAVTVTAAGGDVDAAPSALDVALRWLERLGLAAVVGGAALVLVVVPRAGAGVAAARRALAYVRAGALVQLAALAGLLAREVADIGPPYGRTLGRLLAVGAYGRRVLAGAVVAGALVALPGLLRPLVDDRLLASWRRGRPGELGAAVAVMAAASCAVVSLAGHSSTGGSFAVGVAIRLTHLVAMGVWAGGLGGVVWLRPPADRRGALVAAFSWLALPAMAVLVTSGLLLSAREVASLTALLSTWFGRVLLVKLVALAVTAVWGVRHARAVHAGGVVGRAGARVEAVLAIVLVGAGAALSASSPATGARFAPTARAAPARAVTVVSDAALAPWANGAAVVAVSVGVALVVRRRRRARPAPPAAGQPPVNQAGRRAS